MMTSPTQPPSTWVDLGWLGQQADSADHTAGLSPKEYYITEDDCSETDESVQTI